MYRYFHMFIDQQHGAMKLFWVFIFYIIINTTTGCAVCYSNDELGNGEKPSLLDRIVKDTPLNQA